VGAARQARGAQGEAGVGIRRLTTRSGHIQLQGRPAAIVPMGVPAGTTPRGQERRGEGGMAARTAVLVGGPFAG
jgi:hypothetical protein